MANLDQGWPEASALKEARLHAYGYESMHQFRNWQWYRRLGSGPVVGLGGQQIDVYNWFLETNPRSIMASGGTDYWTQYQWYDNVLVLYEYETAHGIIRASHRLHTSNGHRRYFEQFVGDEGLLEMSEHGANVVYREIGIPEQKWYPWEEKHYIEHQYKIKRQSDAKSVLDVRSGSPPDREYWQYNLALPGTKPMHQYHLENFFAAIQGHEPLNCPAERGYATSASVLRINQAVKAGQKIEFTPKDFVV
jgi:predicted dehydrogenase